MKTTKKLLSLLLCAALLLCGLALTATARTFGDVDADGEIDPADARLALRASVGLEKLSKEAMIAADVDRDGFISSADARLILRASVKLETLPEIGEPEEPEEPEEPISVVMVTDSSGHDDGFNAAVYVGAQTICDANDAAFTVRAAVSEEEEDLIAAIDAAVEEGAGVLVLPGFQFVPAIESTVNKYPDVKFIGVDMSAGDFGEDFAFPANLYCIAYQEELCGFMAGYAAVKLGYKQLGFLGGMAIPSVMRYGYGFVQGADAAAAELGLTDVTVRYGYAGQFYPDGELTEAMQDWYTGGTQIVFACGGGIYGSVAGAARDTEGAKLIGVDVDQRELIAQAAARGDGNEEAYMDLTVTSAVKNHGAAVYAALRAVFDGEFGKYGGKAERLGVISPNPEENAVQLAVSTQFGEGFTAEDYAALAAKLYNGELTVSDDVEKAPADFATVITVDDVGNVK